MRGDLDFDCMIPRYLANLTLFFQVIGQSYLPMDVFGTVTTVICSAGPNRAKNFGIIKSTETKSWIKRRLVLWGQRGGDRELFGSAH